MGASHFPVRPAAGPVVAIHWRQGSSLPDVEIEHGSAVRVLMIDENSPGDRVYEWGGRVAPGTINGLVGDDPIGQPGEGPSHEVAVVIAEVVEERSAMAAASRDLGFTGDACDLCGQFMMRRAGTCLTCQACGTTTGCG